MTFQPNDEEEHHDWNKPITENIILLDPLPHKEALMK